MADGDIIHSRLGGIYQKPYKLLCEGKATIDECAHVLIQAFNKDIVKKGDCSSHWQELTSRFQIWTIHRF